MNDTTYTLTRLTGTTCFECDAAADHDHHVVPRVHGGTKTVPLCETHHAMVHENRGLIGNRRLTKAALQAKISRGELAGAAPFGYCAAADGRTLVEHEGERAIIARVRELRAEGVALRVIVAALGRAGFVARSGKPLALTQVARIAAKTWSDACKG